LGQRWVVEDGSSLLKEQQLRISKVMGIEV